jgi:aminocarboxymuconate-semialdehyde decarboxylase
MHPSRPLHADYVDAYNVRNLIGNPAETTMVLQMLTFSGALERFPGLKIVAAHGGGYLAMAMARLDHGWLARRATSPATSLLPSEALQCVYVDSVLFSEESLRFAAEVFGAERVLLGSDFPADMGVADPVDLVRRSFSDKEAVAKAILSENVSQLLNRMGLAGGTSESS